jgi:valyl-tRNA synthetase
VAGFPLPDNQAKRDEMRWVIDLVSGVRSVRAEMNVPPAAKIALVLKGAKPKRGASRAQPRFHPDAGAAGARPNSRCTMPQGSAQFVVGEAVAALPLGDVIDFAKERARLQKELQKAEARSPASMPSSTTPISSRARRKR